jgi:hypothetical protein
MRPEGRVEGNDETQWVSRPVFMFRERQRGRPRPLLRPPHRTTTCITVDASTTPAYRTPLDIVQRRPYDDTDQLSLRLKPSEGLLRWYPRPRSLVQACKEISHLCAIFIKVASSLRIWAIAERKSRMDLVSCLGYGAFGGLDVRCDASWSVLTPEFWWRSYGTTSHVNLTACLAPPSSAAGSDHWADI